LRKWLRQAEVDEGQVEGSTTAAAREIRELKRKNAELEQAIEILNVATAFFVRERPATSLICSFISERKAGFGSPRARRQQEFPHQRREHVESRMR